MTIHLCLLCWNVRSDLNYLRGFHLLSFFLFLLFPPVFALLDLVSCNTCIYLKPTNNFQDAKKQLSSRINRVDSSLDECKELSAATKDEVRSACIAMYLFIFKCSFWVFLFFLKFIYRSSIFRLSNYMETCRGLLLTLNQFIVLSKLW